MTRLLTTLAFTAAILAAAPASAEMASADQIRTALVGNTFQGGMGGSQYTSFFGEDGTYKDASGGGNYEITADGVCYPQTDFGCYQAEISGENLEWFKDGKSEGVGRILAGNALNF